jgi:hypothetical protein
MRIDKLHKGINICKSWMALGTGDLPGKQSGQQRRQQSRAEYHSHTFSLDCSDWSSQGPGRGKAARGADFPMTRERLSITERQTDLLGAPEDFTSKAQIRHVEAKRRETFLLTPIWSCSDPQSTRQEGSDRMTVAKSPSLTMSAKSRTM